MRAHIFKISVVLLFVVTSCKQRDIPVEVVRRSSDFINCTKIFGYSVKKLEEENEILIQTGTFYGPAEEEDREAAIVKINGADKILYLTAHSAISGEKIELYQGDGYALSIKYIEKKKGGVTWYEGRCRIRKGIVISEYELEGMPNVHDY